MENSHAPDTCPHHWIPIYDQGYRYDLCPYCDAVRNLRPATEPETVEQ